jgi:AcrR family transcriptional regulator
MARAIMRYYCKNMDTFIFSLIQVYGNREAGTMAAQLAQRGLDMRIFFDKMAAAKMASAGGAAAYPGLMQLIICTVTFWISFFHKQGHTHDEIPSEALVQKVSDDIERKIGEGIGFGKKEAAGINFEALEEKITGTIPEFSEGDELLRAVASAVAEAGPWNASMNMVARKSGLSKSSLYSHFKNKQDMMAQLFLTECERIIGFAEQSKGFSSVPAEQFYLVIFAIGSYLRSRPQILVAVDWLRTRKLDLGIKESPRFFRCLSGISLYRGGGDLDPAELEYHGERYAQWMIFLIVNILMNGNNREKGTAKPGWWNINFRDVNPTEAGIMAVTNESFRILFKFMLSGMKGVTNE